MSVVSEEGRTGTVGGAGQRGDAFQAANTITCLEPRLHGSCLARTFLSLCCRQRELECEVCNRFSLSVEMKFYSAIAIMRHTWQVWRFTL